MGQGDVNIILMSTHVCRDSAIYTHDFHMSHLDVIEREETGLWMSGAWHEVGAHALVSLSSAQYGSEAGRKISLSSFYS